MKEKLNSIVNEINSHKEWSKNVKIRYAYIEIGKVVQKDTMFFYTIQNNLMSKDKRDIRYTRSEIDNIINNPDIFDYKVVCRNAAMMLTYVFDRCGIESEIRKTLASNNYKGIEINHYFVVAKGDDDKNYFMTLNPDLPNIQIGKKTSKFAYEIDYYVPSELTEEKNGDKQYYEGEEIKYSVLSDEEIRALDEQIGYIQNELSDGKNGYTLEYTDMFFKMLEESYQSNKEYIDYVCHQTNFYYVIAQMLNNNVGLDKAKPTLNKEKDVHLDFSSSEISTSTWNDVKKFILKNVVTKLYNNYNIEINNIHEYYNLLESNNYNELFNKFRSDFVPHVSKEKLSKAGDFNPFLKFKQAIDLFKTIDELNDKKIKGNKERFFKRLNAISILFTDSKLLPNEGSLSSTYLTNKLIYAFQTIFGTGFKNDFNNLGLAEQVVIIKEILGIVLSDIKKDSDLPNYNYQKSPLRNRIISTVLFDKDTKLPYYLIYVKNTKYKENANVMLVYDLRENKLYTDKTPIDIISDFYVIKDADMKLIIEEFNPKEIEKGENFTL